MTLPKTMFAVSCAGLVFLYGVAVGAYEIFPFGLLNYLQDSAASVMGDRDMLLGVRPTVFLQPARHEGEGVTVWDRDGAEPGLTLLTGFFEDGNELRIVRMDGSLVQRWPVRFSETWTSTAHVQPRGRVPTTDWHVDVEGSLLLPDGSVVFSFAGLGLTKLDRCGAVVWQVPRMTHHSLERSGAGGFWVPAAQHFDSLSTNPHPPLKLPFFDHRLVRLSDAGEVLDEVSLLDVFFENGLEALLFASGAQAVALSEADVLHLNDIEELSADWAGAFEDFAAGDLLLSMRDLNLVMVIDPSTRRVKWHRTGPWIRQHDPDFGPDGTITVYDNQTDDAQGAIFGGSRIVQIDPATDQWSVRYGGRADQWFYTAVRGKHQKLAGGNTLITEHGAGRVFEIDDEGSVVWEFVNRYSEDEVAEVTQAIRYPEGYLDFEDWTCPAAEESR